MDKSVGVSFDPSTDSPGNNRSSNALRNKRGTRNSNSSSSSSSSSAREENFDFAPLVDEPGSATAGLDDFSDDEGAFTSLKTTPSSRPPRRDSFRSPDKLWTKDTLRSKHSVHKSFFETVFEKTIVIDNGSHFTRVGFAGNEFPSSVFRTIAAPVSTPTSGMVDSSQVS